MIRQSTITVLMQNFLFCSFISLILWQAVPSVGKYGLFNNFVHAQAIGNCIAIPGLAAARLANSFGFTSQKLFVVLILLVTPFGVYTGLSLADWLVVPNGEHYDLLADPEQLLIIAGAAVIASTAFYWHWSSREKVLRLELIASEETRRADIARHVMLQAQLEPHMLFNTLANLRALISTDTDRAIEMLDRLDSFMRETLSSSQAVTHSLQHEFEVLDDYLALMQIRLGARLTYNLDLPSDCGQILLPSLLLQPLVENAIRHGVEPAIDGGLIVVSARRVDNHLRLVVANTGIAMSKKRVLQSIDSTAFATKLSKIKSNSLGFGLRNLRERLEQSYGNSVELRFESAETDSSLQGTRVTLRIPIGITGDLQAAEPESAIGVTNNTTLRGSL